MKDIIKIIEIKNILKTVYGCTEEILINSNYDYNSLKIYRTNKNPSIYIPFNINDYYIYIFRKPKKTDVLKPEEFYIYTSRYEL